MIQEISYDPKHKVGTIVKDKCEKLNWILREKEKGVKELKPIYIYIYIYIYICLLRLLYVQFCLILNVIKVICGLLLLQYFDKT